MKEAELRKVVACWVRKQGSETYKSVKDWPLEMVKIYNKAREHSLDLCDADRYYALCLYFKKDIGLRRFHIIDNRCWDVGIDTMEFSEYTRGRTVNNSTIKVEKLLREIKALHSLTMEVV